MAINHVNELSVDVEDLILGNELKLSGSWNQGFIVCRLISVIPVELH